MESVTFNMAQWRAANGYSKVRLANALGVSRWTVARMEEAREAPKYIELACKALEYGPNQAQTPE